MFEIDVKPEENPCVTSWRVIWPQQPSRHPIEILGKQKEYCRKQTEWRKWGLPFAASVPLAHMYSSAHTTTSKWSIGRHMPVAKRFVEWMVGHLWFRHASVKPSRGEDGRVRSQTIYNNADQSAPLQSNERGALGSDGKKGVGVKCAQCSAFQRG